MTELSDHTIKRMVGKAVNNANAAADELEAMGAAPEVVRLMRPRATAEPRYKITHVQAYEVRLHDKIEIGGHLCEIVGIGDDGLHTVIFHALDPAHRVYELKMGVTQPLTVQKKENN